MASLSLSKWARYEPSIPGNAELPPAERFYLEVAAGLTTLRFQQLLAELQAASTNEQLIAALAEVVRLGNVPLALDGEEIRTVADYLAAICGQRGMPLLAELHERVAHFNSYGGTRELFCARPSGGTASTPATSTGPASVQTAAL